MARVPIANRVQLADQQNFLLWSEDFSNASWTKNTGVTVTDNTTDVPDPNGGNGASKLVYDGSGVADDFRIYQVGGTTSGPGEWLCVSVWMRLLSGSRNMRLFDNASLLTSGALSVTATWTRFSYAALSGGGGFAQLLGIGDNSGTNAAFNIYLWGGQMVRANWAGIYVPTTTASSNTSRSMRNTP